jgi:hypothetical protein
MGRFGLPLKKGGISLTAITEALNFFPQRNVRNWLPYNFSLAAIFARLNVAVRLCMRVAPHDCLCSYLYSFSPALTVFSLQAT